MSFMNHAGSLSGMVRCRILLLAPLLFAQGCHSAFVNATVHNASGRTVSLIEVDYPSASFGVQSLAPTADLQYRFKILGSGAIKIVYTDAAQQEHRVTGPLLHEGLTGTLEVSITAAGVQWSTHLREG